MQRKTKTVRVYRARYVLANGQRGRLLLIADHTCSAINLVLSLFGDDVRQVSARPAA